MQIWIYQIKISWIKKFINCWLALKMETREIPCHRLPEGNRKLYHFCIFQIPNATLHWEKAPTGTSSKRLSLTLQTKVTSHHHLPSHFIFFKENITMWKLPCLFMCLFIELRESRDHVCSHHCIPTPRGTQQVLSEYLSDIHLNAWICSTWICTTEL